MFGDMINREEPEDLKKYVLVGEFIYFKEDVSGTWTGVSFEARRSILTTWKIRKYSLPRELWNNIFPVDLPFTPVHVISKQFE